MKSHLSPSPPLPRTGCDPKPTPPLYTFGSPAANAPLQVRKPRAPPTPALLAGLGQRALLGPSPSLSPQQGHGQLEPCLQSHCAWIPARVPSTCPAHLQQQNQQQHWKKWQRGAGPGAHVQVGVHAGDRRSAPSLWSPITSSSAWSSDRSGGTLSQKPSSPLAPPLFITASGWAEP